jgi:hypothetical protein
MNTMPELTYLHLKVYSIVSNPPPLQRERGGVGKILVEYICIRLLNSKATNRKREGGGGREGVRADQS